LLILGINRRGESIDEERHWIILFVVRGSDTGKIERVCGRDCEQKTEENGDDGGP
jgi:hypothetical protein